MNLKGGGAVKKEKGGVHDPPLAPMVAPPLHASVVLLENGLLKNKKLTVDTLIIALC